MFDSRQLKHFCRNGARQRKLRQGTGELPQAHRRDREQRQSAAERWSEVFLRGQNKDGIEVYETSSEVKALTRKERQKKFLEIMRNEYRGRTAKFVRNGHTYYATFDNKDISKNIYGDKRSSSGGYNAKIKVGADGNVFELVENAKYNGSKKETGKNAKAHKEIQYWDYYVKTVQIDDQVYDLVANVRRKSTGDFVYSIQLRGNNTIEASAAQQPNQKVGVNKAANASEGSIPNTSENVKKYSLEPTEEAKTNVNSYSREPESITELRRQNKRLHIDAEKAAALYSGARVTVPKIPSKSNGYIQREFEKCTDRMAGAPYRLLKQ